MAKKCVAILWDIRQRVFGVRLEKNASGALILTAYAQSIESRITFAERLREVYLELDHGRADYVVVGGAVGELICQELVMPEMKFSELHDALGYQLRSLLPIDLSQLNLAFRKMVLPDRAGFCRVRVQAAPGKPLQATFDALAAAGIKADLFLHPFMAVDPLFADKNVFLPEVEPDCYLTAAGEDGLRQIEVLELLDGRPEGIHLNDIVKRNRRKAPDINGYAAATLLASYPLCGDYLLNRSGLAILPEELRCRRFVKLVRLIFVLLLFNVALLGVRFYQTVEQTRSASEELDADIKQMEALLSKKRHELSLLEKRQHLFEKHYDKIVDEQILLNFMQTITEAFPDSLYVTSLGYDQNAISLAVTAGNGAPTVDTIWPILTPFGTLPDTGYRFSSIDASKGSYTMSCVINLENKGESNGQQ